MATNLYLPREFTRGDITRTASTPTEYWSLVGAGFQPSDLTPQQKAARTREANKAAETEAPAGQGNPDDDIKHQAGDANSNPDA